MKLQEFHWWKFSQELTEGHEIECPMCNTWTGTQAGWVGKFARCISCGMAFIALKCPACSEGINHHHEVLRVKMPGEAVPEKNPKPERPSWAVKRKKRRK